jgi:outer membrane protein OmpA-like peptidoglycan-associated protein
MTGLMFLFLLIALAYMVAADMKRSRPVNMLKNYVAERTQIYNDLKTALGPDLQRWHASVDPTTLSVRFSGNTGLFSPGSAQLQPEFQLALNQFFPRYVKVLAKHRADVSEVRIQGYTSTKWPPGPKGSQKYLDNMALSQDRARAVLRYIMGFSSVQTQSDWLKQVISADGFSYSHLIRGKNDAEDAAASDRVEFHVVSDPTSKITAVFNLAKTASAGPKATPTPVPPPTFAASLPAYPGWARSVIGVPLTAVFPKTSVKCFGYLDSLVARYTGRPAGAEVSGWAFDLNAWQPVKRVLLVDPHGVIQGAADGGFSRPDVQNGLKWITSPDTGWHGYAAATSGPVTPWAVMRASRTACRLNVAPVLSHEKM